MIERFIGHRKFVVALIAIVGNQILVWFGKIDPGVYSVVSVATISAYIAGNVYQSTVGVVKKESS